MEENKTDIFVGDVDGKRIEGKTRKEFVKNFLTAVFEQFQGLEMTERLTAYINFFVEHFSYDKKQRDEILSRKARYMDYFVEQFALGKQKEIKPFKAESFEENETSLARLLTTGKGVCQQFAQAFALLTLIDYLHTKDAPLCHYVGCRVEMGGKQMGHAVNAITFTDQPIIIDISSMIHCKEGDFLQDKDDFGPVYLKDYMKSLAKGGNKLLSNATDSNYMSSYAILGDFDEYYKFLNMPTQEIVEKRQANLKPIPIPEVAENLQQKQKK